MRTRFGRISKLLAGFMAAAMVIGSGATAPGNGTGDVQAGKKYPYTFPEYYIDEDHFPDDVFRQYVKDTFDQNHDNYMDSDEITEARTIYCDNMGIETLKGIEWLPELRGIYCSFNKLTELDISKNQLITGIWVSNNDFTKLDFSDNPGLEWLYCFDCPNLTELNVTGNPLMSYLEVNTCPLGSIDVSKNPLLEQLTCATCGLTELDLSNNKKLTHLDCQQNDIGSLDLSTCPKMKRLDIWDNDKLSNVDVSVCSELQYYNCASNNVTSLDLSKNKQLTKLNCGWNYLTSLDLSNNPKLFSLSCNNNEITSLDLSNNPKMQFLMAFTNKMTSLNIGDNPLLITTINKGTKKWEVNAASYSYTIDYGIDDSYGGLDSKYFFCVDGNVSVSTTPTKETTETSYFEGDASDTSSLLTREMVAQTLYALAGSPDVSGLTSRFTDVEKDAWYYNALLWGEKYNICLGFPDMASDTFGIGRWCTKQEMANMVMRYAEYMGYERSIDFGRSDDYADYFDVDSSCWEAVCWAATYRIFPTEGDRNDDKTKQYIKPFKVTTRDDLTYIIQGLQEANKVAITSTLPIPDTSYLPANPDKQGKDASENGTNENGNNENNGNGSGNTGNGGAGNGSAASKQGKWVQTDDGQYNYVCDDGTKETNCYRDGCWLDANGNYNPAYVNGTWKCNSTGWWYEDNGWYPSNQWLKIDGYWYFFLESGYMDYSEYRDGCWLNGDGSWNESYGSGKWHKNSTGWWYSDGDWYPYSQYLWIDGSRYYFNADGYWSE